MHKVLQGNLLQNEENNSPDSQKAQTNAVLDRIKELMNFQGHGSETKLAQYLGQEVSTLSSWRKRGTLKLDVLRTKLSPMDFSFALSGVKVDPTKVETPPPQPVFTGEMMDAVQDAYEMVEDVLEAAPEAANLTRRQRGRMTAIAAKRLFVERQEGLSGDLQQKVRQWIAEMASVAVE